MEPCMISDRQVHCIISSANVTRVIYSEGGEFYCIVVENRRLTVGEINSYPGSHVPKRSLFPKASDAFPPSGTLATLPLHPGTFLKHFGIYQYRPADPTLSLALTTHLLAHEVATLESLRHHPHPNIVEYRGCVIEDELVEGIVFEGYPEQLSDVADKVDHAMVLRDLGSAVEHLHALGIVHNDVNPANVMLPADLSRAVLIDFDSARPEGHVFGRLDKYGTPGYDIEDMKIAERKNDFYGLERIRQWLLDPAAFKKELESTLGGPALPNQEI